MSRKVLSIGGGGVRIYGAIGALAEMESQGIDLQQFDLITCTSAGTIPGVLLIGGKTAAEIEQLAIQTPIPKLIDTGIMGEKLIFGGLGNKALGNWIDSFHIPPSDKIMINTFDRKANKQVIFTKNDYAKYGYGYCVRCSTRLPGAMQPLDGKYIDGGIVENPVMMPLDPNDQILCIDLGYAGELPPENMFSLGKHLDLVRRVDDLVYAFDYKNYMQFKYMTDRFNNLDVIRPKIYDIRSSDFWVTDAQRIDMIKRGRANSKDAIASILHKWS